MHKSIRESKGIAHRHLTELKCRAVLFRTVFGGEAVHKALIGISDWSDHKNIDSMGIWLFVCSTGARSEMDICNSTKFQIIHLIFYTLCLVCK